MQVDYYDLVIISGEQITCDLLCWRRYKMRARKVVEQLLDDNPHLARYHRNGPFLPVGIQVRIPINLSLLKKWPGEQKQIQLYGAP